MMILYNAFSFHLMVHMYLSIFVLNKPQITFEFCHLFGRSVKLLFCLSKQNLRLLSTWWTIIRSNVHIKKNYLLQSIDTTSSKLLFLTFDICWSCSVVLSDSHFNKKSGWKKSHMQKRGSLLNRVQFYRLRNRFQVEFICIFCFTCTFLFCCAITLSG